MNTINFRPAFKYKFRDTIKGIAVFYGIMVAISIGFIYLASLNLGNDNEVTGQLSAFVTTAAIMLFVLGIVAIREDIRLMIQNGIGRRTIFITELLLTLSVSFILAIAGELLITVGQVVIANWQGFFITDLYQMLYTNGVNYRMSLAAHFESIVFAFSIYVCASLAGILISLVFYRLNKIGTIIMAIGAPLFLFVVLPITLNRSGVWYFLKLVLSTILEFILSSPWAFVFCFLLTTIFIGILSWLLMRRAPVKPAK